MSFSKNFIGKPVDVAASLRDAGAKEAGTTSEPYRAAIGAAFEAVARFSEQAGEARWGDTPQGVAVDISGHIGTDGMPSLIVNLRTAVLS